MRPNPLYLLAPTTALCNLLPSPLLPPSPPTPPTTCAPGYHLGHDTVVKTYAHPFRSIFPIINSFKNLTWSFVPPSAVTLNGTNNTPFTSRRYTVNGFRINETLQYYHVENELLGPYQQVHSAANLRIPNFIPGGGPKGGEGDDGALELYIPYDDMILQSECLGFGASLNLTAVYCANDVAVAGRFLHETHAAYEENVERILGGRRFRGCTELLVGKNVSVGLGVEVGRFSRRDEGGMGVEMEMGVEVMRNAAGVGRIDGAGAAAAAVAVAALGVASWEFVLGCV